MMGDYADIDHLLEAIRALRGISAVQEERLKERLNTLIETVTYGFYTVLVLGEFKRGKSSFVNALLGTSLLPMDVLPETATVNILRYAETPYLRVRYRDGRMVDGEVTEAYLRRFSANTPNNEAHEVRQIEIGYPIDLLRGHIELVDTPGVADLDDLRADVTYGILPQAHAVIFLLDANAPLTESERVFIKERIIPQGIRHIFFIVNKYDCVDEEEDADFLTDIERRIRAVFRMGTAEAALESFSLLPLSALTALQGMAAGNTALVAASGLPEVRAQLAEILSAGTMAQERRRHAYFHLNAIGKDIRRHLRNRSAIAQAGLDELAAFATALREEAAAYEEYRPRIHAYVTASRDTIFAMTDKSLQYFAARVGDELLDQIDFYQGQDFKEFIEKRIVRFIQKNIESWVVHYTPHINTLIRSMERELSVGLSRAFNQNVRLKANVAEMRGGRQELALEAEDISGVNLTAGLYAAAGSVALLVVAGATLIPLISFAAVPFLREKLFKQKLQEAKEAATPLVADRLRQAVTNLRDEAHRYIEAQCDLVEQNTEQAYRALVADFAAQVEEKLRQKENFAASAHEEVASLQRAEREVEEILIEVGKETD